MVRITIVSPQDGENIFSGNVTFSAITSGCVWGVNCRLQLWFDEKYPSAENAIKLDVSRDFVLREVAPGEHVLRVEAVDNQNQVFEPRAITMTVFHSRVASETPVPTATLTPVVIRPTTAPLSNLLPSQPLYFFPAIFIGLTLFILGIIYLLKK